MGDTYIGKCTNCGKENEKLAVVDEVSHVCLECLACDYFYCDICKEYWHADFVEEYELKDGRTACEHCSEDLNVELFDENPKLTKLLNDISKNEDLYGDIYETGSTFFIISDGEIIEISNDASCSPKGGWFPEIVKGITPEQDEYFSKIMAKYDIDECFFKEMLWDCDGFDEESALEYYEEGEEKLEIYKKLLSEVGNSPFDNMSDFVDAYRRWGLEENTLYYEWEGEWIDFYENISDFGECRGTHEEYSDEEWIEILENIEEYKVM